MKKKCRGCLCCTCITSCHCQECEEKIKECKKYNGFRQISIFDLSEKPKYKSAPRYPLSYYGLTNEAVQELKKKVRSCNYAIQARQAALEANEMLADYILLSINKKLSYDGLEKLWAKGEIEWMPYGRSDFYGFRRLFFSLFDRELRRIGK